MGRKVLVKILTMILIFASSIMLFSNSVFAGQEYSVSNIFKDAQDFLQTGKDVDKTINTVALHNTSNFIYKLLFSIGLVVAIIVGMVLGIQFMISSAEDKAKVKEALIAYVVSCIVLFGAYGIWRTVINMVQDVTTTTEKTAPLPNDDKGRTDEIN